MGGGAGLPVDVIMILLTLAIVGLFMIYQVSQSRIRAREMFRSTDRGRRMRMSKQSSPEMIDQLRTLYHEGKISERTYYEVLKRLQMYSDDEA